MEMKDDTLISYLLGEASAEEAARVEKWRAEDRAHEARYQQFQQIWETSRQLKFNGEPDALASLARLKQKAGERKAQQIEITISPHRNAWTKIAAAVLLLVGATWFYMAQRSVPDVLLSTRQAVKTDTLPDGSVLILNRKTTVTVPGRFASHQRHVSLHNGEVFFNIAPDKANPFLIEAGTITIKVTGTSFNVKNKDGDVEVIVETGTVQVSTNGNQTAVVPGQKVTVKHNTNELIKERTRDQLYAYYRTREFIADDTPLWRMVEVLNEAYDSHIIIGRPSLRNLPLNIIFKNDSLNDILQVISRTFRITVKKTQDQIILQ
ncbi:MAG: FecR domain-containing protein [Williamsia sp.]|nr:FecR domain-containing protein [Williamsia sp.]